VAAEGIIRELDGQSGSWTLGTTRAHVLRARGELDLCRGEIAKAASFFRQALHIHQDMDAALEAAAVRLRLCRALLLLGDTEGAALELDSGEKVLTRNKAHLYRGDCGEMRSMLASLID